MTPRARQHVLSGSIRASLLRLGNAVRQGAISQSQLMDAIAEISVLPPKAIARVEYEIADAAMLYTVWMDGGYDADRRLALRALDKHPGLEHIFIFHHDGRLREAALKRFENARSPFYVVAIAYRLNDWVAQVRRAAEACAAKIFPTTYPAIIAQAAIYLLDRRNAWQRCGDGTAILDETLFRPDVVEYTAGILRVARTGAMGTVLRHGLRSNCFDPYLLQLAESALLPDVKAVALQTLIQGQVSWRVGSKWHWIDKSRGRSTMVPVYESREVVRPVSVEHLIELGIRDRFVAVRRVAADGVIQFRSSLQDIDRFTKVLSKDTNKAVQERVRFLVSVAQEPTGGSSG